jgi:DNA-binding NarL/FixJ family response regulator
MPEKIKIAITDDHPGVIVALKTFLEAKRFEVVIEAKNGKDLICQIADSSVIPDLCILDGNMPLLNGSETTAALKLKWPAIQVIGFTMDNGMGQEMLKAGAAAFVLKASPPDTIVDTINALMYSA